jgi:hypothetical protein
VTVAVGEHIRAPRVYRGRDIKWWMDAAGVMDDRHDEQDDILRARGVPSLQLAGTTDRRSVDLNRLTALGVRLVGRLVGIQDGRAQFSGSLRNQCELADLKMNRLLDRIDAWATSSGLDGDRAAPSSPRLDHAPPLRGSSLGSRSHDPLGHRLPPHYSWIDVPSWTARAASSTTVASSDPAVREGIPFLRRRKSTLIDGAADDARDLSDHLVRYLAGSKSEPETIGVIIEWAWRRRQPAFRNQNLFRRFLLGIVWIPAAVIPAFAADWQVGTPETLGVGITETVDQIMKRDQTRSWPDRERDKEADLGLTRPVKPRDNPLAPFVSQWPPEEATSPLTEVFNPQTVGTTFRAVAYVESEYLPPDSMGDVGPTQVMVQVNGRIKAIGKTGLGVPLNATQAAFWATVNGGLDQTDPQIRYDRLSGRWFATAINLAPANNRIMIAVSSGPTITGAASFTFFQFQLSAGGGTGDTTNFCDYPSLGVDANALYIGCNMVDLSAGAFMRTTGYVVRKSSVTGGGPLVVTAFRNLANPATAGPYSPRGVDNDDPAATQGFFIGADILSFGTLQIRRISDPGGTPTISGNLTLAVPATSFPIPQPALGSTPNLITIDDRLFMASIHKNKITGAVALRTAHHSRSTRAAWPAREAGGTDLDGTDQNLTRHRTSYSRARSAAPRWPQRVSARAWSAPARAHGPRREHRVRDQFVGIAASGRLRTDRSDPRRRPPGPERPGRVSDRVQREPLGNFSPHRCRSDRHQTVWTFQEYATLPRPRTTGRSGWSNSRHRRRRHRARPEHGVHFDRPPS